MRLSLWVEKRDGKRSRRASQQLHHPHRQRSCWRGEGEPPKSGPTPHPSSSHFSALATGRVSHNLGKPASKDNDLEHRRPARCVLGQTTHRCDCTPGPLHGQKGRSRRTMNTPHPTPGALFPPGSGS